MLNNIAVVLRGHRRTWNYVFPAVFDFYDKLAKNVDYYFITWRVPNFKFGQIEYTFNKNKKNLIKSLAIEPDTSYYNSYMGASYLSYNIIPYMYEKHRKNPYDFVFNSRPDIIYKFADEYKQFPLSTDTLYTTNYVCQADHTGTYHIGVDDHLFASSFDVNLIMSMRHTEPDKIGCHARILQYATENNIKTVAMRWLKSDITRPVAFEKCPNPLQYFDRDYKSDSPDWVNMPREKKLELLYKHQILEDDYTTQSVLATL